MGLNKINCYRQIWCILLLWISLCSASAFMNVIVVNTLSDGEVETRIKYKKISAKETTVGKGYAPGLKYRQILRGNNFLQLIYDNDNTLNDCEFIQDENISKTFLTNFKQDLNHLLATSNASVQTIQHNFLPQHLKSWLDMRKMRRECKKLHSRLRTQVERMKLVSNFNSTRRFENSRNKRSNFIFPGTKWCGISNRAKKYTELGVHSNTDRCCRHHDRCKRDIPAMTKKYNLYNLNFYTLSHCFCDERERRDIGDFLRVPGTKWCGKGFSAEKYTRLGMFSRTDRCCRKHDTSCPFWIGGFSTKYGLYNWRINTIMHCGCDERFRACLKLVGTSDANVVGKLFFNIVQSQCFVLKYKKRCIKRSWWGKCEKHKFVKYAILRDNLPY